MIVAGQKSIYLAITKKEETYEQLDLFHADTVRNGTQENQKPAETKSERMMSMMLSKNILFRWKYG